MKAVFASLLLVFVSPSVFAVSLAQVNSAARAASFPESQILASKAPFSVRKTGKGKDFSILAAYPKEPKTTVGDEATQIAQLSLNCNQCKSKKLGEAFAFACYEDVQTIARDLKIDLPGGVIKQFEGLKVPEETWNSTDKKAKSFRFTKTISKCDRGLKAESIRFDFFFNYPN